jgi:hypothetical protein
MLAAIRKNGNAQVVLGLLTGICFGFLLQKGGTTDYGVIVNQLLLTDFTVLKLMLSAVIVGMVGMLIGAGIFAEWYPALKEGILARGPFPAVTVPDFLHIAPWITVVLLQAGMIGFLLLLEYAGL